MLTQSSRSSEQRALASLAAAAIAGPHYLRILSARGCHPQQSCQEGACPHVAFPTQCAQGQAGVLGGNRHHHILCCTNRSWHHPDPPSVSSGLVLTKVFFVVMLGKSFYRAQNNVIPLISVSLC